MRGADDLKFDGAERHHIFVEFAGAVYDATIGPETGMRNEGAYRRAMIDDNEQFEQLQRNHKAKSVAVTVEIVQR